MRGCLLALLLLSVQPRAALADDPNALASADPDAHATAQRHLDAGRELYRQGAFESAIVEFERGWQLEPRPAFVYNLAHCWNRLNDKAKTLAHLEKYLAVAPEAEDRRAVERWIDNLRAERPGTVPPPDAEVGPTHAPTVPVPARSRTLTWIALGGAVAAATVGGVLGGLAKSAYDDLDGTCGATAAGCAEPDIDAVRGKATGANVLLVAAGTLAVTAVVLWFVEPGEETP